jgi:type II secretory pathway component PulF
MQFRYEQAASGRNIVGLIEAATMRDARHALASRGVPFSKLKRLRPLRLASFWELIQSLATLLQQNFRLSEALDLMRHDPSKTQSDLAIRIQYYLHSGRGFAESLDRVFNALPREVVEMIAVAESGARLGPVLKSLSDYHRDEKTAQRAIVNALSYPAFVVLTALIVCWILFDHIVPGFKTLAVAQTSESVLTGFIFAISGRFGDTIEVLIWVCVACLGLSVVVTRIQKLRELTDRLLIYTPVIGRAVIRSEKGRFYRLFSQSLQVDLAAERGFQFAVRAISNTEIRRRLEIANDKIRQGRSLDQLLLETEIFDERELFQIRLAEHSASLKQGIYQIHSDYVADQQHRMLMLAKLVGPIAILILGIAISAIALGIVIPIFSIQQTIEVGL